MRTRTKSVSDLEAHHIRYYLERNHPVAVCVCHPSLSVYTVSLNLSIYRPMIFSPSVPTCLVNTQCSSLHPRMVSVSLRTKSGESLRWVIGTSSTSLETFGTANRWAQNTPNQPCRNGRISDSLLSCKNVLVSSPCHLVNSSAETHRSFCIPSRSYVTAVPLCPRQPRFFDQVPHAYQKIKFP